MAKLNRERSVKEKREKKKEKKEARAAERARIEAGLPPEGEEFAPEEGADSSDEVGPGAPLEGLKIDEQPQSVRPSDATL